MKLLERINRLSTKQRAELIQQIRAIPTSNHIASANEARLVAYYVPKEGETVDETDLRSFLKSRVPAYMVPSSFVSLSALPLTPNGKVDRRALPAPQTIRPACQKHPSETSAENSGKLRKIWQEVLNLEDISLDDNFFDIGGHSLLAMQVIARLRDEMGLEMPVSSIFKMPTLKQLADGIDQALQSQQAARRPSIQRVSRS